MTDHIPADQARRARQWARDTLDDVENGANVSAYARDAARTLIAMMPRPTLADMTEEERDECRWMQCDVQGQGGAWLIVAPFDDDDEDYAHVVGRQGSKSRGFPAERITPRTDLPRMEWTDTEKPAPALPDGWRLADHRDHGRVIVTNPFPDCYGAVYFAFPRVDLLGGLDWKFCDPDELTYLDSPTTKEADQ